VPAMQVIPFDPVAADAATLDACVELQLAAARHDHPAEPPPGPAAVRQRLTRRPAPGRRFLHWLATAGSEITGLAYLVVEGSQADGLTAVDVTVAPGFRRRGIGTALLRELTLAARDRQCLLAEGVVTGSAGQAAADALGFAVGQRTIRLALDLPGADRTRWQVPDPAGYQLAQWTGSAPAGLLASYAAARNAISEAPHGDLSFAEARWTPDRVRDEEATARARDCALLVVAALAEPGGPVAGLSCLEVYQARPDTALQQDTAVLTGHRGHGLGVWLKAANLRRLTTDYPQVRRVTTSNAADNRHMLAVNEAVGFTVRQHTEIREVPVPQLAARLGL